MHVELFYTEYFQTTNRSVLRSHKRKLAQAAAYMTLYTSIISLQSCAKITRLISTQLHVLLVGRVADNACMIAYCQLIFQGYKDKYNLHTRMIILYVHVYDARP